MPSSFRGRSPNVEETKSGKVEKTEGGLFAAKEGHLNQLTEDPTDGEPDFSVDGRKIAFVRAGDIWAMRADGTGQHKLTSGTEIDSRPQFDPKAEYVVFTLAPATAGGSRDLYRVNLGGAPVHSSPVPATSTKRRSRPTARRSFSSAASPRPGAALPTTFTRCAHPAPAWRASSKTGHIDEFSPRHFKGGIVFSRGQSGDGPGAYADIFTMRSNGTKVKVLVAGAGSSFVEDVAPAAGMVLFRRDQGLWVKKIGPGRAHKLSQVADNSSTDSVFSSDGRKVAAFMPPTKPRLSRRSMSPAAAARSSPKASRWKAARPRRRSGR